MPENRNDERHDEAVKRGAPLGAPLEVYLGIFDAPEAVRGLLDDLADVGVPRDGLAIFVGPDDATAFEAVEVERLKSSQGGGAVLRKLFAADEVEREKTYHDAALGGAYVVQVPVPEDDKARRAEVEKRMLERGGRYLNYFGRLTFQEVVDEGERQGERR